MRVVTTALIVLLAAGTLWAATPAEVLKGAKSVHIIAPAKALDDITDLIVAELPLMNIEGGREDADVIIRFIVTSSTTAPSSQKQEPDPTGDRTGYTGKIGKNESEISGDAIGTVSNQEPKSTAILFSGRMTKTAAKEFAREIVKVWKEANPPAEAPKQ